ncbi:MAG: phosphoribosylformylglycinamidine synthase subunit PurQ, partial [Mogibacterium diversum]|nr:phosphoribosylformylglycinamidine synthase subunit PurQ [Mogibacterium diversum]
EKGMKELVSDLNVCSKRGLSERFDSTIGCNTVLMPFGGVKQRTPIQAMVHKIPMLEGECSTVSMMSYGFNPYILEQSPYHGAYLAIVESVAKLIATGASYDRIYLSLQEYFEKLGDNDKSWGKAFSAVLGAFRAQMELGIGAIGGKDSMSGTFEDIHVPPTLISFAVTTDELCKVVSPEFKGRGHEVVWLRPELGEDGLPKAESLIKNFKLVRTLVDNGLVAACYTPGFGGPAEAVFKMAIGNNIGFEFDEGISMREMFGYAYGSFIIETSKDIDLTADMKLLGKTVSRESIGSKKGRVRLLALNALYEGKLEPVYSCNIKTSDESIPEMIYRTRSDAAPSKTVEKPKFLIPVFPGTNCEYDTARAVEKAGGEAEIFIVNNLTADHLKRSVKEFAAALSKANVLFIPGGFSGADEPDGSGKFITSFLRNEAISAELMKRLTERDGLVAGICNGFQALIKLGLLPYGEIGVQEENSPTITFNKIGRHQSKLVRTKVCSTRSPWLKKASVGQILTVPISHGEGRFVASSNDIDTMLENGQILTQYVDFEGNPTMDIQFNPNGSSMAIEG